MVIRPIEPEDRELLALGVRAPVRASHATCGSRPRSSELSEEQLSYLTVVDHHDHEALLAVDPERDDAVGVARFVRVGDGVAECAIVVADEWQNRGLGAQLLDRLVERAREEDVERFTALVLADNTDALRLLERLGRHRPARGGSQVELEIELPARARAEPAAPPRSSPPPRAGW